MPADAPHGLCPACLSIILASDSDSGHPNRFALEIGPYELLNEVGRGGAGVVFRARDRRGGELVALKILTAGRFASAAERERFAREAQAVADLAHPGIVPFLDLGEAGGQPFLAMRWIEGQSLADRAKRGLPDTRESVEILRQVAAAIHHAHEQGIVHRDLKPSNILVTPTGEVCIVDFGLARHLEQDTTVTRSGEALGTPGYLPPEQCGLGATAPGRAGDIYSLGGVIYFALTGRPPFLAGTHHETLAQVLRDEPLPPTRLNPGIPRDLESICLKCLEKNPVRRYATAAEFGEELERFLNNQRVRAHPVGPIRKVWRFARRHGTATVSLTAMLLLIAGFSWHNWRTVLQLRNTAPSLAALSQSLVTARKFPEALERVDLALRLQPANADYLVAKGHILQALLRIPEAREAYADALKHNASLKAARENLALCDELIASKAQRTNASDSVLTRLHDALVMQGRSAEAYEVSRHIDTAAEHFLARLQERLAQTSITNKLHWTVHQPAGLERGEVNRGAEPRSVRYLTLNLEQAGIEDLSPLRGIPLNELQLGNSNTNLTDLAPLSGMPLVRLILGISQVADLTPLTRSPLEELWITFTRVTDLGPLRAIPTLRFLVFSNCDVRDLSPLRGAPLEQLHFGSVLVTSLEPLRGMPLETLGFSYVNITDISPLLSMPLREFHMHHVPVADISPLSGMPLRGLFLNDCPRITDLSPLNGCKSLERLILPPNAKDIEFLRDFPNLKQISYTEPLISAAEFWKIHNARQQPRN